MATTISRRLPSFASGHPTVRRPHPELLLPISRRRTLALLRCLTCSQILDNDNFGVYIEQEPYVRDLLESYMGNRFKLMLETLERYSVCTPTLLGINALCLLG